LVPPTIFSNKEILKSDSLENSGNSGNAGKFKISMKGTEEVKKGADESES